MNSKRVAVRVGVLTCEVSTIPRNKQKAITKNVQNKQDWENVTVRENMGRRVNVYKFNQDKKALIEWKGRGSTLNSK